jgi:hypothetical protein
VIVIPAEARVKESGSKLRSANGEKAMSILIFSCNKQGKQGRRSCSLPAGACGRQVFCGVGGVDAC